MKTETILNKMMNKSEEELETKDEGRAEKEQPDHPEKEETYDDLGREGLVALVEEQAQQIDELERQRDETKNTMLRKVAELDNYRKRVQRERSEIYKSAKMKALEDFLDISDDLKRTLHAAEDQEIPQSFLEGVTLLANKFDEVLTKHGVERIDEEMVPFDVDLHDALMRKKPEDDAVDSDMVLKVVENGYKIDERVVRHAKVIVSE